MYFYEKHMESVFSITQVKMLRNLVSLTFPWKNEDQFSLTPNRKLQLSHSK